MNFVKNVPALVSFFALSFALVAQARINEGTTQPHSIHTPQPAATPVATAAPTPQLWHGPRWGCRRIIGCE